MKICTVSGSMRHYNQMLALANELTLDGWIVLLPFVLKIDDPGMDERLQKLHKQKIDISDKVFIIGIPGQSTLDEFQYARSIGKLVEFLQVNAESATWVAEAPPEWLIALQEDN